MNRITSIVLASVVSCLLTVGLLYFAGFGPDPAATYRIEHRGAERVAAEASYRPGGDALLEDAPFDFTYAAERVAPAVVFIRNTMAGDRSRRGGGGSAPGQEDLFRRFFGPDFQMPEGGGRGGRMPAVGAGSGVIISADGYIVTNNHVIDESIDLEVRVGDKDTYKATLIGTDPTTDIALLKIDADRELPFIEFADSDAVRIGQWVAAVGNPLELATTVTAGIVSAKGRSIGIIGRERQDRTAIEAFIQTDAAVNPGNSGGALVDLDGNLVGINTAIASRTGSYAGYSFAVPSQLVRKVVEDLKEFGTVQRGFIGAQIIEVNQVLADERDLPVNYGVYIDSLTEGSSAREAGLRSGDVVVAVDGRPVRSNPQLLALIGRKRPGDLVELTYLRGGDEATASVTLRGADGTTERVRKTSARGLAALGIDLEPVDDALAGRLRVDGGIRVTEIRSGRIARQTDMAEGFVITRAGDREVRSVEDFERAVAEAKGILVVRGRYEGLPGEKIYAFDPK